MKKLFWILIAALSVVLLAGQAFAQEQATIDLKYDDRKSLESLLGAAGTEVAITDEVVASYQVGSQTPDEHVLQYDAATGTLYAVGTGTATLTVDGKAYAVKVEPAPISLFMITGHSGGAGQEGNGMQSVAVEAGQAYSSYYQTSLDVTKVEGYGLGYGSANRVGADKNATYGGSSYMQIDAFAPGQGGTRGVGSGFAYRWNQLTGEKVWVINIAVPGSSLNEWVPGNFGHNTSYDLDYHGQAISKFTYAQTILKNEVAANHYTLSHQGVIMYAGGNISWYSGWSMDTVQKDYEAIFGAYEQEFSKLDIDGDGVGDGLDVITVFPSASGNLQSGDRPAMFYMAASEQFPKVAFGTYIHREWLRENGLEKFPAIDYTTQSQPVQVPVSLYPLAQGGTSDNSLYCYDKNHYNQVGYNAIGLDLGVNMVGWLKDNAATATAQSVELSDYYGDTSSQRTIQVGETLYLTPRPQPVNVGNLTFTVTGAAKQVYPLGIQGTAVGTATLTVKQGDRVLETVTFNVTEGHTHCVCGGHLDENVRHSCDSTLTYVPLTEECFTPYRYVDKDGVNQQLTVLRSGNYYLTGNYTRNGSLYIAPGTTVNICLNGYRWYSNEKTFKPNGGLTITDCSAGQTGQVYSKQASAAPLLYGYSGARVDIYGGTWTSVAATTREYGGCFALSYDYGVTDRDPDRNGVIDEPERVGAVMNIYGGKFVGGDLNCSDGTPSYLGSGSCVVVASPGCALNIYGGTLQGGNTVPVADGGTLGSGVVSLVGGELNIYGGNISGGTAEHTGAVSNLKAGAKLTVYRGSISGGAHDLYRAKGTIELTQLPGAKQGATFPGGITVGGATLAEVLGSGAYYSKSGQKVTLTDGQTEISGDVTVKIETLKLKYDDRKTLESLLGAGGTEVVISHETVTSNQVGSQRKDAHVLHYDAESGTLYAVGVGSAMLTVDGKSYAVEVEPAVITLIMYTGHSVGHGAQGDARQSVVVEAGQAYSIFDPRYVDFTQTDGYGLGWGSEKRVSNEYQYVTSHGNNYIDAFAPDQDGTRGAGSALAWQWNNLTGEKVWVLNTAVGGSCLNEWMPNASWHSDTYSDYYNTAVKMYTYAQTIIKNEIAAGHYELGHMGLLYYCGANDKYYPAWNQEKIESNYEALWNNFSTDLAMDVDGDGVAEGPEYIGLVPYWVPSLREKLNFDKGSAQFMASSAEYPHLFIASNGLRDFMWDENLVNFPAINYTTQSLAVSVPTSAAEVEGQVSIMAGDNSHPTQVAYNYIGIETANNLYARRSGADTTVTELTLVDESFNELSDGLEIKVGEPYPVAPWFEPYYADDLSYSVSGNAELIYPLQLVGTAPGEATLTVSQNGQVIKTLTVNVVAGHGTHCVCGGKLTGIAAQQHGSCDSATQWLPLDSKWQRWHEYEKTAGAANEFVKVLTAGNYYLEADMTWSGSIYVAPGEKVNICLNGHTLTTTGRSFQINGTLNICDCQGGGRVYSQATGDAPVAYVCCHGAWNIYGGTYDSVDPVAREYGGVACLGGSRSLCDATDNGAAHVTGASTVRLYAGTLKGCALTCTDGAAGAAGNGGCINIRNDISGFYMYGGTLDGGKSLLGVEGVTGANYGGGIIGSTGIVELWGGKLCNSTDPEAAVYVRGGSLAIKGDVTFENNTVADISVADGKSFSLEAEQTGKIVVAAKAPGTAKPVTTVTRELGTCLAAKAGHSLVLQNGKAYVVAGDHNHCVCGGKLTGTAADAHGECGSILTWEPLKSTCTESYTYAKNATTNNSVNKLKPGNYYLEGDMSWSGVIYVAPGDTVNICLNGHKLTTSSRSFSVNGTLNICDCKGGGQVYSKSTGDAPVAYVACHGVWNVYGGSFSAIAPVAREYGGVACLGGSRGICDYSHDQVGGTLRLYDGIFYGCELTCIDGTAAASGNGGCVNLRTADSYFYMYGGTLSGGKSLQGVSGVTGADYGGGIIGSIGTVELWAGKITGSTDTRGAVYGRSGSVTLKGSVTFENNGVADIAVHPNYPVKLEAEQNGSIVFNALSPGTTNHAIVADYDKVGCVKTRTNYTAVYQDGKVYIVKNADLSGLHTHCVCGGKAENVGDHECLTMPLLYKAWTDGSKLPTSGTYYLDTNVTTSTRCDVTSATLRLCLNSHTVTSNNRVFNLKGAAVDMCDCSATEGSITSSNNGGQALITTNIVGVTTGSEFNLYSGKLIHTGNVPDADGIDEAPIQIKGFVKTGEGAYTAQGIMRMYGGTVQGGTVNATGATINVQSSSATMGGRFYMYGGNLIGGNAVNGGALSLVSRDSQAFIYGGTISGGVASGKGNNVYVELGKLYVYGGNIGDIALDPVDAIKRDVELYVENATVANMYVADSTTAFDPVVTLAGKTVVNSLTRGGTDKKPVIDFSLTEGAAVNFSGETAGEIFGSGASAAYITESTGLEPVVEGSSLKWVQLTSDALKFASAAVTLYSDLGVQFKADSALFGDGGFSEPYAVFTFGGESFTVTEFTQDGGRHIFHFRNIAPQQLGDTITATLYATKDGKVYQGRTVTYSVKQYCYNMLGKYAGNAPFSRLLVDLLNYGAAAQNYTGYQTDALVNAELTQAQKALGTQSVPDVSKDAFNMTYATVENPSVTWEAGGLYLQDKISIRLTLKAADITDLAVTVELDGKTYTVTELVAVEGQTDLYYVYFDALNAAQLRDTVLITAYRGEEAVSNTVSYSVECYVAEKQADANTALADLVNAIICYGDAAKVFVP